MGIDLDERQADIPSAQLWELTKALRSAESCETFEDFRANVHQALVHAEIIVTALRDIEKDRWVAPSASTSYAVTDARDPGWGTSCDTLAEAKEACAELELELGCG